MLSTRRDLLPPDYADELAKLQDRVPPFPAAQSRTLVEKAFGRPSTSLRQLRRRAVASASIAQVHFATLPADGREVPVKVLRPACWR